MTQVFARVGRSVVGQTLLSARPPSKCFQQHISVSLSFRIMYRFDNFLNRKPNQPSVRQVWGHNFHTTPCRRIHPIVLLILRPVSKILAVILGRRIRVWWKTLPESEKQHFWKKFKSNRKLLYGFAAFFTIVPFGFYLSHLEETPFTKRRRFILFSPDKFDTISSAIFDAHIQQLEPQILKTQNSDYNLVSRVANRLLAANKDLPQIHNKSWSITIVKNDDPNAFVLPSGQIFVYTGMLKICNNEDQLGVVLGHEMAHSVLGHTAELLSYTHILDMIMMVVVAAAWAFLPTDLLSALTHWISTKLKDLLLELPYSRMLEAEADQVGLHLSAKACFDIRESSAFWARMDMLETLKSDIMVEWLSTHPSHDSRVAAIEKHLPMAIELRTKSSCPPLPRNDPRDGTKAFKDWVEDLERKKRATLAVPLIIPAD